MDRNTIIGLTLIFILLMAWQQFTAPTQEEIDAQRQLQDSIATAEQLAEKKVEPADQPEPAAIDTIVEEPVISDSLKTIQQQSTFGPFATAAVGEAEEVVLENDLLKATISTKGGIIKSVELKEYFKATYDEKDNETKTPLKLLEDDKNKFEYFFPISNLPSGGVSTADLFFEVLSSSKKSVTLRASTNSGGYFEQTYTLEDSTYLMDYDIKLEKLNGIIGRESDKLKLTWVNYLDKLERNTTYEQRYSTVYFKTTDDDPDYCSCTGDDKEEVDDERIKWISNANQFFNSSIIADEAFESGTLETKMLPEEAEDLKLLVSNINIPYAHNASESFGMNLYIGPNEFDRLYAIGDGLQDIIPFGRSIFGSINRWIIRPLFGFLSRYIGSAGIVILVLTVIVKLLLYPLTYRMLYSQSKMGALKPRIENLKDKHKDDSQQQQVETMKLYRGVWC